MKKKQNTNLKRIKDALKFDVVVDDFLVYNFDDPTIYSVLIHLKPA
jgi:hypothetical protein